ncbi:hypothetical protein BO70DRAFT_426804 [Aspergillus heteromorphus CBS 117.55]|uniref:Uncharacterized protein n=1 Tax=Aspergillus heteromorphus CBS 117.55 TaxID=1448321 RepID=A0A317WWF3_9EURO|nr:uncharacterized protein BO70DRAFT_426804 [Aspergillus heteromorphus CBS 117.55]PWY89148.1 hypothetical protein BO70DRAFT_426804 [Aspergillus heteromorphus CBS 117.55]
MFYRLALLCSSNANWDEASFAIYTLITLPASSLSALLTTLNDEWTQNMTDEAPPLVRTPPVYDFTGTSLREVVQAHSALDKGFTPRDDSGADGNIQWYPTAFIVVTSLDWRERGLVFVYVDGEDSGFAMEKFVFMVDDAYLMLSSLSFGDESLAGSRENYGVGE